MPYVGGDFWRICDLSGKKVLASQTRRTWDGLIVFAPLWYPKNPQLDLKGIPDRMAVPDARPRPADEAYPFTPGLGSFCLLSPGGIPWTFYVADDGALLPLQMKWGTPQPFAELVAGYLFTVDDDGALHVGPAPVQKKDAPWRMASPSGLIFGMTVDIDLAVHLTLETGPDYMEGVFTLVSSGHISYTVYIVDDTAVIVTPGMWGPNSSHHFLDSWKMYIDDDGALHVEPSGEQRPTQYRMVSTGGYEYMWNVDPDGAVKIGRQGHWWDVPVIVHSQPTGTQGYPDSFYDATGQVTQGGQERWMEE